MKVGDKIVVISGASSGIGAAAARLLAQQGARVVLLARREAKLAEVAESIRAAGGQAEIYAVDLAEPDAVMATGQAILAEVGVPDVIVNNAGAGRWLAVDETDPAEAIQMMNAPYFAAFFLTRALLTPMIERGSGLILNVNSPVSRITWPGATGYVAARWALRGFNAGLASDVRGTGVRVCEYIPGETSSNYFDANPGAKQRIPRISKLFRQLTPEQAASGLARAIRTERRLTVKPVTLLLLLVVATVMPRIVRAMVDGTGWRRGS